MAETPMAGGEESLGLVKKFNDRKKRAVDHSSQWRKDAWTDFDFAAGEQWEQSDKQLLREQLRPIITFNRVGPIIDAVAGSEINNRQEVRYLPRTTSDDKKTEGEDDSGVNEMLSEAARWVRDQCDAEDEESDAFMDAVTCGMGWTETRMDYENDLDGEVRIDRTDPLEMWWDPDAKKRNLIDARWVARIKNVAHEDIKAMWPAKASEVIGESHSNAQSEPMGTGTNANSPDEYQDSEEKPWDTSPDKKTQPVVEYQWWEREAVYRVQMNGKISEFDSTRFARLKDQLDQAGIKYLKQTRRVYKRAFLSGDVILEEGLCPCETDFTYQCVTAKRNRNKNTWFGLVRAMKDPQMWANKFYSQILHIINSNAKGGIMAEDGAFPDQRKAEKNWAKSDSVITTSKGALARGAIQPKPSVPYPTGLDRLMEFAVDAHYSVTGVNLEMLGMADRNQAGVLEYQRREAGLTILGSLFDSLRRYRKVQGRVLLYFITEYISDDRLVRVTGKAGAEYVPLSKQDDTLKYDIIVDEAATSPNQKERTFQVMSQILPMIMKTGVPIPPEILDYSPLPQSLVIKWKKMIQGQGQVPPEIQQQMEELQQQAKKLQEENAKLKVGQEVKLTQVKLDDQIDKMKFVQGVKESDREFALRVKEVMETLELQEKKVEGELKIKEKQSAQRTVG
jgi:hypothetical protein